MLLRWNVMRLSDIFSKFKIKKAERHYSFALTNKVNFQWIYAIYSIGLIHNF